MLIFHEDNKLLLDLPCADNVVKINVHRGGLATLIAKAVAGKDAHIMKMIKPSLHTVLQRMPYLLAEFKIGVTASINSSLPLQLPYHSLAIYSKNISPNMRTGHTLIRKSMRW